MKNTLALTGITTKVGLIRRITQNSSKIQGGREASCVPALKPVNTSGKAKIPMSTIANQKWESLET